MKSVTHADCSVPLPTQRALLPLCLLQAPDHPAMPFPLPHRALRNIGGPLRLAPALTTLRAAQELKARSHWNADRSGVSDLMPLGTSGATQIRPTNGPLKLTASTSVAGPGRTAVGGAQLAAA